MDTGCPDSDEPTSPVDGTRRVPHVAVVSDDSGSEIFGGFPGHFVIHLCPDAQELESRLLGHAIDLVVLDCRKSVPEKNIQRIARRDPLVETLAVGKPEDRRSLPSWLVSHACPWPIDSKLFYRLVVATAKTAALERGLRRQRQQIAHLESEARLGRQLARALHEINNPLDAVMRFLRLASDDRHKAEHAEFIDKAQIGLRRMAEVLHELHSEARQVTIARRHVDLDDVIREAVVVSGILDDTFKVQITIPDGPHRVPAAVATVMINLIRNAKAACGARGTISIRAHRSSDRLIIDVQDDGEGFGELFKDELFKPGFTTKSSNGLGLGLFHSRHVVERLGGDLDATSPGVGRGATFTINLPWIGSDTPTEGTDPASSLDVQPNTQERLL